MKLKRILVTGSRYWRWRGIIWEALDDVFVHYSGNIKIVHGACPRGADIIAHRWAKVNCVPIERHPAKWNEHGRVAGFIRNTEMVQLGADRCLAFILSESAGATDCARKAEEAGIYTVRYER